MRSFALSQADHPLRKSALLGGVDDSMPLAGGMTLLPTIKQRLAAPAALIDLSKIPQLSGIAARRRHPDGRRDDPPCRGRGVANWFAARSRCSPSLAAGIGDPAVRNRGTIGGSVANNDPSADYPAAVLALDATVVTDRREIAADAFFRGLFETALEPGEIITALRFPGAVRRRATPNSNRRRRAMRVVGVCVAKKAGKVRVAVTGAGPGVFRVGADGSRAGARVHA